MVDPRSSSRIAASSELGVVRLTDRRPDPLGCPGGGGGGCGPGGGGGVAGGAGGGGGVAVGGSWLQATAAAIAMPTKTTRLGFMACLRHRIRILVRVWSSERGTRASLPRHSGRSCCRLGREPGVARR